MPTQTEAHLQVIADKIENIEALRQAAVGNIKDTRNREIAKELRAITAVVSELPKSFISRYSNDSWIEVLGWESLITTAGEISDDGLDSINSTLDNIRSEISRHINADTDTQNGVIQSLNNTLGTCSTEWYSHVKLPYLLVYATAIALLVRIEKDDINFSPEQAWIYIIHILYVLVIVLEIQFTAKFPATHLMITEDYYTNTEFYDAEINRLLQDISDSNRLLRRRKITRIAFSFYWLLTFVSAIIITWSDTTKII